MSTAALAAELRFVPVGDDDRTGCITIVSTAEDAAAVGSLGLYCNAAWIDGLTSPEGLWSVDLSAAKGHTVEIIVGNFDGDLDTFHVLAYRLSKIGARLVARQVPTGFGSLADMAADPLRKATEADLVPLDVPPAAELEILANEPDPYLLAAPMTADEIDPREAEISAEIERLRIRDEARRRYNDQRRETVTLPPIVRLDTFLAQNDPAVSFRIEGTLAKGGRTVLAAQKKAGKSTMIGNLLHCLADGVPFLGKFTVNETAARIVLIDNELDPNTLRRWLRAHRIHNEAAVEVISLRGHERTFDILDDTIRAQWAAAIGQCDVLVFDCLRPVLDALGLNEHTEAGRFLTALDALKAQTETSEVILVHHMGHNAERSRGDSRIEDWPDAIWKIFRSNPDDLASPRYFSAYGRDVEVPEGALDYDPETRTLTYGDGTRRDAARSASVAEVKPAVLGFVRANEGKSGEEVAKGVPGGAADKRAALAELVSEGLIKKRSRTGRGGGFAYFAGTPSTPSEPRQDEVRTPSTPFYKTGLRFGEEVAEPRQPEIEGIEL